MKLITSGLGTVVLNVSSDEVAPEKGALQRDLIQYVGSRYNFSIQPTLPQGVEHLPSLVFRAGRCREYAVQQIALLQNGDAVTAMTTDLAEIVLEDLVKGLRDDLGFRYDGAEQRKVYSSGLVVQFDKAFDEKIGALRTIEEILNQEIPRAGLPFDLKSIAFGAGDISPQRSAGDLLSLEATDFTLQRRQGVSYSENRYFSVMPLPTQSHLRVLQRIEDAVS